MEQLEDKKVKELREIAKAIGIKGVSKMKKQDLINEIMAKKHEPTALSEILSLDNICKIKGKSGLWIPHKNIRAPRGKFTMRFLNLLDHKEGVTVYKYNHLFVIGNHPELVEVYDKTYDTGEDIEVNLTLAGYSQGEVKKYSKIYEILCQFLANAMAETE